MTLDLQYTYHSLDTSNPNSAVAALLSLASNNETDPLVSTNQITLQDFGQWYRSIYGYIVAPVCVIGILANIFCVTILCQKYMRTTTNFLLIMVSVCHLIQLVLYFTHIIHYFFHHYHRCDPSRQQYVWVLFSIFYSHFTYTVHGLSTWLMVVVAILRFLLQVCSSTTGQLYKIRLAKKYCAITTSIIFIVCIPKYMTLRAFCDVSATELYDCPQMTTTLSSQTIGSQVCVWHIRPSSISERMGSKKLETLTFWIKLILFFAVPLVTLSIFLMFLFCTSAMTTCRCLHQRLHIELVTCRYNYDVTLMLLVISGLFLLLQLPQGMLAMASAYLPEEFEYNIRQNLGDFLDFLWMLNCSMNFWFYFIINQRFRETFKNTYWIMDDSKQKGRRIQEDWIICKECRERHYCLGISEHNNPLLSGTGSSASSPLVTPTRNRKNKSSSPSQRRAQQPSKVSGRKQMTSGINVQKSALTVPDPLRKKTSPNGNGKRVQIDKDISL